MKKILLIKTNTPEAYDDDAIGEFLSELDKKLGEWYEVIYCPSDMTITCPTDEDLIVEADGLIKKASSQAVKDASEAVKAYLMGLLKGAEAEKRKEVEDAGEVETSIENGYETEEEAK